MYVVVIGMGQVGRHVLRTLEYERHGVVAIDADPDVMREVEEHHDVATLVGYGASPKVLREARAHEADLVVAVTDHDEVNMLAALAAKRMGCKRVIARIQGDAWATCTDESGVEYGFLGVDVTLNPRVLLAQEIAKIARSHGALEVIDLAADRIELVKMKLDKNSRMLHKQLAKLQMPPNTLVALIVRDGEVFVPGGADHLLPDDQAYIVGLPSNILAAEDLFSAQREARRVAIVGGGVVGKALAKPLVRDGARVTIIEKDRERAEALAGTLEGVTVVHGDGTNLALLLEEEIGRSDLFAAVSHEDEVNLMACLLAHRAGVARTVALCHRPDYTDIYRQLGVDVVLSPRLVASDHVLRYSRQTDVKRLTALEDGKAEVLELVVGDTSPVVGIPMKSQQLNWPRGALICAILGRERVIIPRGDDVIQAGDTVIVLATRSAIKRVSLLFRPRLAS
ncbi:MAG: Trk system potassium transporter TrkA [Alphaproteobacteria bacterium]|nr:Trk system potassium transporter TrkA [Alphaproteobacteria bacterium]